MSIDNNTDTNPSTSLGPKGEVSHGFNKIHDQDRLLNSLSPVGREDYLATKQYGERSLEQAQQRQRRSQPYRLLKAQVQLQANYIRNPAPRPQRMVANPNADLKIIREQAQRQIKDQDIYKLKMLQEQSLASLNQIVERDRAQSQTQNDLSQQLQKSQPDQEQER